MDFVKKIYNKLLLYWKQTEIKEKISISFLALMIMFLFLNVLFFSAPAGFPQGTTLKIEKGDSLSAIAKKLDDGGYVKSQLLLKAMVIFFSSTHGAKAGDYFFNERDGVVVIAKRISSGNFGLTQQKVTIPEGFTNEQIANIVNSKFTLFDKKEFMKIAEQGKMFPDTYFFLPNVDAKTVAERMKANFDAKMDELKSDIENNTRKFNEILIMASILEEEAKTENDRKLISGVLWKRFDIGMPLQVDPAPETYEKRGLPDKPISNPGIEAIKDAIYPIKSPYLYYLSDLKGRIYYAKDFEEHQKNRELYFKK